MDERVNLTQLAYQAYTNNMIKPSDLAKLSVANQGSELTSEELVKKFFLIFPSKLNRSLAVNLTSYPPMPFPIRSSILYDRNPNSKELSTWASAVKKGLSKYDLPLAILRSTSGRDTYRVGCYLPQARGLKPSGARTQWLTATLVRVCCPMHHHLIN